MVSPSVIASARIAIIVALNTLSGEKNASSEGAQLEATAPSAESAQASISQISRREY